MMQKNRFHIKVKTSQFIYANVNNVLLEKMSIYTKTLCFYGNV